MDEAFHELNDIYETHRGERGRSRWARPLRSGKKLDQLAVDDDGSLVLLELKDGSSRKADVYYSPFQLLQYVCEWHSAWRDVKDDVQRLIDARKRLGLTPKSVRDLTGGIRAAIGFGNDAPGSDTEVRFGRVLEIVNRHLPGDMGPVEVWKHSKAGPEQVYRGPNS